MTEVSFLYMDKIQPQWYQNAIALSGYAWCMQGGVIVAGSMDVATVDVPGQTGNTNADILAWLLAAIQTMTGDAPQASAYPVALPASGWGAGTVLINTVDGRTITAFQYTDDYTFGLLNIPAFTQPGEERKWYFKVVADDILAGGASPSSTLIGTFFDQEGFYPTLWALELNPE